MPPYHMVLTALDLTPTTYTLLVPGHTLDQYAIALTIRLSLMCVARLDVILVMY